MCSSVKLNHHVRIITKFYGVKKYELGDENKNFQLIARATTYLELYLQLMGGGGGGGT